MGYVFPKVEGLGHSAMARQYAIKSCDEAISYFATPMLGARLIQCTRLVLAGIKLNSGNRLHVTLSPLAFSVLVLLPRSGMRGEVARASR